MIAAMRAVHIHFEIAPRPLLLLILSLHCQHAAPEPNQPHRRASPRSGHLFQEGGPAGQIHTSKRINFSNDKKQSKNAARHDQRAADRRKPRPPASSPWHWSPRRVSLLLLLSFFLLRPFDFLTCFVWLNVAFCIHLKLRRRSSRGTWRRRPLFLWRLIRPRPRPPP